MGTDQGVKECTDKEKPNQAEIDQIFNGKLTTNPADNTKCFMKCVVEKPGVFKDGNFVDDKVKALYSAAPNKDFIWKIYEGCKVQKGANDCDTVFKVRLCMANAEVGLKSNH